MADLFETANLLSVLLAGRRPEWREQVAKTGIPASATAGVNLADSPRSLLSIALRRDPNRRSILISITTLDLASTYRVIIAGATVDYDAAGGAPADEAELLGQWAAAIEADGVVGPTVDVTLLDTDGDGVDDAMLIKGSNSPLDFAFAGAVTVGTATYTAIVDAVSADAVAWMQPKGPEAPGDDGSGSGRWHKVPNGAFALDSGNFVERLDTAGLERGYIQIDNVVGDAGDAGGAGVTLAYFSSVHWGPSIDERQA